MVVLFASRTAVCFKNGHGTFIICSVTKQEVETLTTLTRDEDNRLFSRDGLSSNDPAFVDHSCEI